MSAERPRDVRTRPVLPLPRQGSEDRQVGQVLLGRGLLSDEQLSWALDVQRRTRSRLGDVLVSTGLVSRMDLHRALARAWDLPFVDVPGTILDPALLGGLEHATLSAEGWLPLHRGRDGRVLVAVVERPGPALRTRVEAHLGAGVDFAVTSQWDLAQGLTTLFGDAIVEEAARGLRGRAGARPAGSVPTARQRTVAGLAGLLLLVLAVLAPLVTLAVVVGALALAYVLAPVPLVLAQLSRSRPVGAEPLADDALPVHTVLLPAPRGTGDTLQGRAALAATLAALAALDHPADKLQVLLLVADGDTATRDAATEAGASGSVTFLPVPSGGPQTRAMACNVGLLFARGDLLLVLDVGDEPEPAQLRRAAEALQPRPGTAGSGDPLVAVQASVRLHGAGTDPLARVAELEQEHRSAVVLPGRAALGLPLPVGGTGSHVRTGVVRSLGGWDPSSDAADTDLGLRTRQASMRVGVLAATTRRPVVHGLGPWTALRTTELTARTRAALLQLPPSTDGGHPGRGRSALAAPGGASLLGPAAWAVLLALLLLPASPLGLLPGWLVTAAAAVLAVGTVATVALGVAGAVRADRPGLAPVALLLPVVGVVQAVAAAAAAVRLLRPRRG